MQSEGVVEIGLSGLLLAVDIVQCVGYYEPRGQMCFADQPRR